MTNDASATAAETIARHVMGIPTLTTRNNDRQDFREVAVWTIKAALEAAFAAGQAEARKKDRTAPPADDEAGWLVMTNDTRTTNWLAVEETPDAAEDAARDWLTKQADPETTAWVVKVARFIHHPEA